ncbi:MAG: 2-phosphosulfolactate phosphatase [Verrucomicrobiota bacterium]
MGVNIEVLLSPAEYQSRRERSFTGATCVVFDVLRATSVMITGLANGAQSFIPVEEISEALTWKSRHQDLLLAGERDGLRIQNAAGSGIDFDLGNSPREYRRDRIAGRNIVTTTTNGTRALRTCVTAEIVVVGSFLNLTATTQWLRQRQISDLMLVCAGTGPLPALEDILCAGALVDLWLQAKTETELSDAAKLALLAYRDAAPQLTAAIGNSQNGARLLANPDLRDDVAFCLQRDVYPLVAALGRDGKISPTGG